MYMYDCMYVCMFVCMHVCVYVYDIYIRLVIALKYNVSVLYECVKGMDSCS